MDISALGAPLVIDRNKYSLFANGLQARLFRGDDADVIHNNNLERGGGGGRELVHPSQQHPHEPCTDTRKRPSSASSRSRSVPGRGPGAGQANGGGQSQNNTGAAANGAANSNSGIQAPGAKATNKRHEDDTVLYLLEREDLVHTVVELKKENRFYQQTLATTKAENQRYKHMYTYVVACA